MGEPSAGLSTLVDRVSECRSRFLFAWTTHIWKGTRARTLADPLSLALVWSAASRLTPANSAQWRTCGRKCLFPCGSGFCSRRPSMSAPWPPPRSHWRAVSSPTVLWLPEWVDVRLRPHVFPHAGIVLLRFLCVFNGSLLLSVRSNTAPYRVDMGTADWGVVGFVRRKSFDWPRFFPPLRQGHPPSGLELGLISQSFTVFNCDNKCDPHSIGRNWSWWWR